MTKTTKTVVTIGCALAVSFSLCALCLVAGAMHDDDPNAVTPQTAPVRAAPSSALDGRYGCFQMRSAPGFNGQLQPKWFAVAVPGFLISGSTYPDANTSGTVEVANNIISFNGGNLDGWRGQLGADSKPFIAIGGDNHREVTERTGNGWSDFRCYPQND